MVLTGSIINCGHFKSYLIVAKYPRRILSRYFLDRWLIVFFHKELCVRVCHSVTRDVGEVGRLMHVNAHSMARVQQRGVFDVHVEIRQLFLGGFGTRFKRQGCKTQKSGGKKN